MIVNGGPVSDQIEDRYLPDPVASEYPYFSKLPREPLYGGHPEVAIDADPMPRKLFVLPDPEPAAQPGLHPLPSEPHSDFQHEQYWGP